MFRRIRAQAPLVAANRLDILVAQQRRGTEETALRGFCQPADRLVGIAGEVRGTGQIVRRPAASGESSTSFCPVLTADS
jgi:hypothetical protein